MKTIAIALTTLLSATVFATTYSNNTISMTTVYSPESQTVRVSQIILKNKKQHCQIKLQTVAPNGTLKVNPHIGINWAYFNVTTHNKKISGLVSDAAYFNGADITIPTLTVNKCRFQMVKYAMLKRS